MARRIILAITLFTLLVPFSVHAEGGNYIGYHQYRTGDIDGDGRDDIILTAYGYFYIDLSTGTRPSTSPYYGGIYADTGVYNLSGGFVGLVGDFDGDCLDDLASFSSTATLKIDYSRNGLVHAANNGDEQHTYPGLTDLIDPRNYVVADFDGDGKDDFGRLDYNSYSTNSPFRIDYAANGFGTWDVVCQNYGYNVTLPPLVRVGPGNSYSILNFKPAAGDFDGDGKADIAIWNSNGVMRIDYAANGFGAFDVQLGGGYIGGSGNPYAADFTGDGIADIAVRPDDGRWAIDYSTNGLNYLDQFTTYNFPIWASSQDPGDFDGDGKADLFFISDCFYGGCGNIYKADYSWNGPNPGWDDWNNQGTYLSRLKNERRAHRYFVRQQYVDILNRLPDQGGWDFWTGQILQCGTDLNCSAEKRKLVAREFFFSSEFVANNPLLDPALRGTPSYNQEFVRQCYLAFLRREPDPGGWTFWTNNLNSYGNPTPDYAYTSFMGAFIDSQEYWNRDNGPLWIPN
jgi:hypothetical protein